MSGRFIFCKTERLAYATIYQVATKYGAYVFPHLRIKEVANRDWINEEEFDYALKGHVDFTITVDFRPVLAIELDGKFHQNLKARERDKKKDAVCAGLGIPLVRLDYGHMRAELLQPILADLVEVWLSGTNEPTGHRGLALNAADDQLAAAKQYCGGLLEVQDWQGAELRMCTNDLDDGYSESFVELSFGTQKFVIGTGRSKVPPSSPQCGRSIAERIALAQAGWYVRTRNGTARDAICDQWQEVKLPTCSACTDSASTEPMQQAYAVVRSNELRI